MSNTTKDIKYLDENQWEITRRESVVKSKNKIEITGKTYTEKYVIENELLDDFVLTRDMICSILQLSDQVIDSYIMPKLDIAYAETAIRNRIKRPKIQVVVSKRSLMQFINEYIGSVQEKQEIYIVKKIDYDDIDITNDNYSIEEQMINTITIEIFETFKNRKYIQQFLDFSTSYLENHIYNDFPTKLAKDRDKVISIVQEAIEHDILNGLQSYRSIAATNKYKHTMQARRYVNRVSHYVVRVNPLEPDSKDKKAVIRFVMFPTVYLDENEERITATGTDDVDTKESYTLIVKTKTLEYLTSLETGYPMAIMVLKSIVDNIDTILGAYKKYLEERKSKK